MKIKISTNEKKIGEILEKVQGKTKEREIGYNDIVKWLKIIEEHLSITKKSLSGTEIVVDPWGQKFPNAYKYTHMSTHFSAVYANGNWYLTDIKRSRTEAKKAKINLSDEAKRCILDNHSEI